MLSLSTITQTPFVPHVSDSTPGPRGHIAPTVGKDSSSPGQHFTAWKFKINELNIQIPGKELPGFFQAHSFVSPQGFAHFFPTMTVEAGIRK